jgi:hypothetical protein
VRTLLVMIVIWTLGAVHPVAAQWQLGLEVSLTTYHGSAHDTSASHVASEGRPGGGPGGGLTFGRDWGRVRTTLRVTYANPGFAVAGSGVTVTDKTTGQLLEFAALVSTRVGGIGSSGAIRADLGPSLHLWDFDGEFRKRLGAVGAAVYEWPVTGRFTGSVRLEGMLGPSWFNATDVPPEFERRATWRYGMALGLRYRLT